VNRHRIVGSCRSSGDERERASLLLGCWVLGDFVEFSWSWLATRRARSASACFRATKSEKSERECGRARLELLGASRRTLLGRYL
jgi:hypothetical protein